MRREDEVTKDENAIVNRYSTFLWNRYYVDSELCKNQFNVE